MNKANHNQKQGLAILAGIFGSFFLVCWLVWNSYPVEAFIGSFMSMVDPQRHEHVYTELEKKSDNQLFRMLWNGDSAKQSAATMVLAKRERVDWFDKFKKLLRDKNPEVRSSGRGLLFSADNNEANVCRILLEDIQKYQPAADDYLQVLLMLVKRKDASVYPYLVKYAQLPSGWKNASAKYFEELGNPDALDILYEQRKMAEAEVLQKTPMAKSELKRINQAIATLEAIKKNR